MTLLWKPENWSLRLAELEARTGDIKEAPLRRDVGQPIRLERKLVFRWVLATGSFGRMAERCPWFGWESAARQQMKGRVVCCWLLRSVQG